MKVPRKSPRPTPEGRGERDVHEHHGGVSGTFDDARSRPVRIRPVAPAPAADTPPAAVLEVGELIAGKYELTRLIGGGGMGSVWEAKHLALDTSVAIKFMAPVLDGQGSNRSQESSDQGAGSRTRFEREAKAAAQLRMANVVQVFDYGIDRDLPYLVMELLTGENLGARIKRQGRLSLAEMSAILTPIARALQHAHSMGLVHRDLKPENIFLAQQGGEEVPKILDFGVVKALQGGDTKVGDSTSEGTVIGTVYYTSPEQALGRTDIDHRSDLWSLGVIAFQAITGKRPFKSDLLLEAVVEICTNPIPKPTDIAPDLSAEVDAFFERALERDLDGRFQSAKELAEAFDDLQRATSPETPRRTAFRASLAAGAALLLLGTAWGASRWLESSNAPAAPHSAASADSPRPAPELKSAPPRASAPARTVTSEPPPSASATAAAASKAAAGKGPETPSPSTGGSATTPRVRPRASRAPKATPRRTNPVRKLPDPPTKTRDLGY